MRYDADHKQRTRTRVLAEAARAIRTDGPHRLGVAEVMAKAGLTHGGFYAHFGSRDALVASAVARMVEDAQRRRRQALDGLPPGVALSRYLDTYLSVAHRDARGSGCPLPYLAADAPRLAQPVREQFAAACDSLRRTMAELMAALGLPDAEAQASSVVAELVGAMSLARAEPRRERSDALLAASRAALKRRLGLEPAV